VGAVVADQPLFPIHYADKIEAPSLANVRAGGLIDRDRGDDVRELLLENKLLPNSCIDLAHMLWITFGVVQNPN
jgi:hypothetical protein